MKRTGRRYPERGKSSVSEFEKILKIKGIRPETVRIFQRIIYEYYRTHCRDLPWRKTKDPYKILVSEIMLQQTQVERVIQKYEQFIAKFPDFFSLSKSPLQKILFVWQGLGYNRRAMALKKSAQRIVGEFNSVLPSSDEVLITLEGVGRATASAVAAFVFNKPSIFVETNIRRVFIHFFFQDRENVRDSEILPLVEKTLDTSNPREWYYALMDYGVLLKKTRENPNKKSAHHTKQSPFHGSHRQLRGMVLKTLLAKPNTTESVLAKKLTTKPERLRKAIEELQKEGFIKKKGRGFIIA